MGGKNWLDVGVLRGADLGKGDAQATRVQSFYDSVANRFENDEDHAIMSKKQYKDAKKLQAVFHVTKVYQPGGHGTQWKVDLAVTGSPEVPETVEDASAVTTRYLSVEPVRDGADTCVHYRLPFGTNFYKEVSPSRVSKREAN